LYLKLGVFFDSFVLFIELLKSGEFLINCLVVLCVEFFGIFLKFCQVGFMILFKVPKEFEGEIIEDVFF